MREVLFILLFSFSLYAQDNTGLGEANSADNSGVELLTGSKSNCTNTIEIAPNISNDPVLNIDQIETTDGIVHVLDKDNSGSDPDGNFFDFTKNIVELMKDGEKVGFKREIMGGICTTYCNPSTFEIYVDTNGNYQSVKPTESGFGLQAAEHTNLNESQVKVLNEFVKKELARAKEKGSLDIKNLMERIGGKEINGIFDYDGVTGATMVEDEDDKLALPGELKGAFNTVATVLLYAYDTQKEVLEIQGQ